MDNIKVTVEHGNVSDTLKDDILKTFLRRIENIAPGTFSAHIVINPNLSGWNVESLSGNAKRYIIDDDNIVDDETRIRLATLKVNNTDFSLLYIFEKLLNPIYMPTNIHKDVDSEYIPSYQSNKIAFLSKLIVNQKNRKEKDYNIFCISGDTGNGKTYFVKRIAEKTNSTLWKLTYSDVDAENTDLISRKTDAFFKKVKENDFVLIENADSFLCGRDINRFVKNVLVSVLNMNNKFFTFIETTDPSLFDNDIKKNIFAYIYIKPLIEEDRKRYLAQFLKFYGITVSEEELNDVYTAGLSVKELKEVSYITSILAYEGAPIISAISQSIDEINVSKLNSTITSNAPFTARKPKYKLDDLVLPIEKKETIQYAAALISNRCLVYNTWNFSAIDPYPRAVLNFYGKPGTGKTMCAHAIADYLGKDLLALNYAEIESKYIGDAPKKLESAFAYAKQHDVVMFFDEADSFLGKRIEDVSHSADQALNSLRSTMLIQLEMFEGVVIFASNLRENYDKAFRSRFLYEIEFDLPNMECRKEMLRSYGKKIVPITNAAYSEEQIDKLSILTEGLSGREIKSSVLEALNKLAYNATNKANDLSLSKMTLPIDLLSKCIEEKVKSQQANIVVKTDMAEDKKKIAEGLMEKYGLPDEECPVNSEKYSVLIELAYCAAWSDGILDERELLAIKSAEKDLGVTTKKDYTNKENIPKIDSLIFQIQSLGLEKQAVELCCRIISVDGTYLEEEITFIHDLCHLLDMPENQVTLIDEIIELMAKESRLLDNVII